MPLNFPNTPTANQIYTDSTTGNRYLWDDTNKVWRWTPNTVLLSIQSSAPPSPLAGQLWWNADLGRLFIYYTDADSSQWVEASPIPDVAGAFDTANNAANVANSIANTLSARVATLDFGNTPVYSNSFNIADTTVTTSSKITATISSDNFGVSGVYAGDEMEMDQFFVTANVVTNGYITFAVMAITRNGPLKGKRNILYSVS